MLSIDSGGNYHGYIGDLCRMAVLGEPDAELEDRLAEIEAVQQAAFAKPCGPARAAATSIAAAEAVLKAGPKRRGIHRFLRAWHGADHATRCRS